MKVLVFVKATPNSEKGINATPDEKLTEMFTEMGKFNEALVKAGIMVEGDGLKPSSAGKRIKFSDQGHTAVVDGPFAETKELVAGYWVWNVKSMEEAVEWAKKCPNPMPGEEGVLEIRPTYTEADFGDAYTDEHKALEDNLRKQIERRQSARPKPAPKKKASPAKKAAKNAAKNAGKNAKKKPARAKSKK
jgi:hypothetical protein